MVGWHCWHDGQELEQAPGVGDGQGGTGKPGVLQSMGSQRVRHDWATELNCAGLCCCADFSLVVMKRSYSLVAVHRLLVAVASLVVEHRLQGTWASAVPAPGLQSTGSMLAHRLSCSTACGIFPDQGWNPCLRHHQADSYPLSHQGNPDIFYFSFKDFTVLESAGFLCSHLTESLWHQITDFALSNASPYPLAL